MPPGGWPSTRDEATRPREFPGCAKRPGAIASWGAGGAGAPEARLSVRDYGPGIAPEHLPRLTERFYRVDTATSRAKGGTGLGLAIVKHIALRHRARLSIESRPGEGARFTIAFPAEKFETNSIS